MRSRILTLLALTCVITIAVATVAPAGAGRESTIPSCEELLTKKEAGLVMREPIAEILTRTVTGSSTRACGYFGGRPGATKLGHGLYVSYGPYLDNRKMAPDFAKKYVCPISKAACKKFLEAAKLKPDRRSFAALELALRQIGITKLQPRGLDNPAFLWVPSRSLAPLDEEAFVVVYISKSAHLLQVGCSDTEHKTADVACAIRGAIWVETSVT
ncbi:MAG: hypothetical protein ACKVUT_02080 [Gaiella sp.]